VSWRAVKKTLQTVREELRSVIIRDGVPVFDDVENVVKRLLRLVQIASNPALVDESYSGIPCKFPHLEDIIRNALSDPAGKAIVWTNFTENAIGLRKRSSDTARSAYMVT